MPLNCPYPAFKKLLENEKNQPQYKKYTKDFQSYTNEESLYGPSPVRLARLALFTGLAKLMSCFLIKFVLCLYEKTAGLLAEILGCLSQDLNKRPFSYKHKANFIRKQGTSRASHTCLCFQEFFLLLNDKNNDKLMCKMLKIQDHSNTMLKIKKILLVR